jgi:hypothetical protein
MNKQGQVFIYTFMVGLVIIILGLAFAPGLKNQVDEMRNSDNLDCGNTSISDFDKGTCVATDGLMFIGVMGVLALAFAVIAARKFL